MSITTETLRQRVQSIMPDLEIRQLEVNKEGLINDVVIVNGAHVFRFAKKKEYASTLDAEARILDLIRSRVGVDVPAPIFRSDDCMVYPLLDGEPLLLEQMAAMDAGTVAKVAQDLGEFLFKLHTTDLSHSESELPPTLAPVTRERWLDIYPRIKKTVYPLLWKHQVAWAERVFNGMLDDPQFFDYKPALVHGDLRPYHILIDSQSTKITGVIDFGVAGVGDPASDFGTLINTYGESLVNKMKGSYPDLEKYMPRARFYAQSIELHWVLLGVEWGENCWFIAHLGCARDVHLQRVT
ncbi:MAG: phosphotransferase [bacterium]